MGQLLATLPTCAHLSPDSQARLHTELALCLVNPKPLNECLRHISPTARPPGSCQHRGRCPHPRSPRGRGAGKNLLHPYHRALGRLQPVKAKPLRGCFASLDRFPAPSASVGFATPTEMERGQGDEVVHFTLDAWNRPNTHRRGRWIGFATCPCGLASESGVWGKAPKGLFLFLKLLGGCNRSKGQKNVHFRIFATKNTANLANF